MPQNKPMKIQWLNINGRQVPMTLPQTYSHDRNDWVVTSDKDPLPVVEYGTTAGGIIVPKRVSDEGHELTQVTGSNVELPFPQTVFNEPLNTASGSIKTIVITPPDKQIWKVHNLRIRIPAIENATGNHHVTLRLGTQSVNQEVAFVTNEAAKFISVLRNTSESGGTQPQEKDLFYKALKSIAFSKDCPLYIRYENASNLENVGIASIFLTKEVEYLV